MIPDVRGWRRWTWILLGWSAIAGVLVLAGLTYLGNLCEGTDGVAGAVCSVGAAAGKFSFVFLVFWVWLLGFLLLALGWFARRPIGRVCPPYGHPVRSGATACPTCGYDFVAAARAAGALPGAGGGAGSGVDYSTTSDSGSSSGAGG